MHEIGTEVGGDVDRSDESAVEDEDDDHPVVISLEILERA